MSQDKPERKRSWRWGDKDTQRPWGEVVEKRRVTLNGWNRDAGTRKPARGSKEEMEGNMVKKYACHTDSRGL